MMLGELAMAELGSAPASRRKRIMMRLAIASLIIAPVLAGAWYAVEWFQDAQWHR
jgi:hypothetical protein